MTPEAVLVAVLIVGLVLLLQCCLLLLLLLRLLLLLLLLTMRRTAVLLGGAPVFLQRQIKHGVVRIAGDLLNNVQKLRHAVLQCVASQRRIRLQQHQTLTTEGRI